MLGGFLRKGCASDSQHGGLHRRAQETIGRTGRNRCDPPEVVLFWEAPDGQDLSAGRQDPEGLCGPSDCQYERSRHS